MRNPIIARDELHDDLDIDSAIGSVPRRSRGIMGDAQSRFLDVAEDGKRELARSFDGLVTMANELAAKVDSAGVGVAATLAWQAAGLLSDLQRGLHERPVDELLDQGRTLIRDRPAVAVGAALAAGFIASRLLKSTSR